MNPPTFLDLPNTNVDSADVVLLPLPYEGTVCYGKGTARAPAAILEASAHVETWDEQLDFDLATLRYHTAPEVSPHESDTPQRYLDRVFETARTLNQRPDGWGRSEAEPPAPSESAGAEPGNSPRPLVVGLGGEHSLTPPLVRAACPDPDDLSHLTVVQIDAHSDLRDQYEGTPHSHACAMRRLVERGARVIAVGIRSADREEFHYGEATGLVRTFFAQQLAEDADAEHSLLDLLASLSGDVYVTVDVDGLDVGCCPGTGTPQPGGLGWWQALRYLRQLLYHNRQRRVLGCDLVEVVPQPHTQVNEFAAARLLAKLLAYTFAAQA